jgi:CTP:molybdopterin cytidylyltransferase MocA
MIASERIEPPIVGVIVAAGGSKRMGRPKAWLEVPGWAPRANGRATRLIEAHIACLRRRCARVIAVLGDPAMNEALPADVEVVWNPEWATTHPSDSLALALATLPSEARVVVTPVDAPPVPIDVLDQLLATDAPAVPTHDGHWGHPVVLEAGLICHALAETNLRQALEAQGARTVDVAWPGTLLNFNTPRDWTAWLADRLSPMNEPAG